MSKKEERISAPTTRLEFAELEKLESLVFARKHSEALNELFNALGRIRSGGLFEGHSFSDEAQALLCTRLAGCVVSLFADPTFFLSEEGYARFALEHPVIELVFSISGYGSYDFLIGILSETPSELDASKLKFSSTLAFAKMTLFLSLGSHIDMNLEELFSKAPRITLPIWASMLSHVVVLSPRAHERREALYGHTKLFKDVDLLPPVAIGAMSDAYMYCSYRTVEHKHDVKREILAMFHKTLSAQCAAAIPTEVDLIARRAKAVSSAKKPHCLIPLEWFNSFHAMHRCYAPLIKQLREHFTLTAIVRKDELDDIAKAFFDDIVEVPQHEVVFEELIKTITALEPDIIYYPSLGMNMHWTAMASLRLAPIQCVTLGHPATSGSDKIDYALVEQGAVGDLSLMTERVVSLPKTSMLFFQRRPDLYLPDPVTHDSDEPIRIAVPAMALKINVPFMDCLKRIESKANERIEFHFFPNTLGLSHIYIQKKIRQFWFPDAIIRPRIGYAKYLEWLSECDLHLSTFPFSATNGAVDSLLVGLPIVTRTGPEPMERFESLTLEAHDFGDLVARDTDEFERIVLGLINDRAKLRNTQERIRAVDWDTVFFGPRTGTAVDAFGRAMLRLFSDHELIVNSGKREIIIE